MHKASSYSTWHLWAAIHTNARNEAFVGDTSAGIVFEELKDLNDAIAYIKRKEVDDATLDISSVNEAPFEHMIQAAGMRMRFVPCSDVCLNEIS